MFQGQTRHKSRARKKTKYIHKNERGSSTRVSLKREQKNLNSVSERAFLRPKIISRLLERVAGVMSASGRTLIIISSRPLANHSLTLFSQSRKLTRRRRNARPAALVMRSCSQAQLKSSNDPLLLKRKLKDLSLFIAEGKGRGKGKGKGEGKGKGKGEVVILGGIKWFLGGNGGGISRVVANRLIVSNTRAFFACV